MLFFGGFFALLLGCFFRTGPVYRQLLDLSQISSSGYNDCHFRDDARSNGPKKSYGQMPHSGLKQFTLSCSMPPVASMPGGIRNRSDFPIDLSKSYVCPFKGYCKSDMIGGTILYYASKRCLVPVPGRFHVCVVSSCMDASCRRGHPGQKCQAAWKWRMGYYSPDRKGICGECR